MPVRSGTTTGGGPSDGVSVIVDPSCILVPSAGSTLSTVPFGSELYRPSATTTVNPRSCSCALAFCTVAPTSDGTGWLCGSTYVHAPHAAAATSTIASSTNSVLRPRPRGRCAPGCGIVWVMADPAGGAGIAAVPSVAGSP